MKRFTVTKTGKVMRGTQNARHLRSNKSKSQQGRYHGEVELPLAFSKLYKKLMA